jgi:hypothetical protein
MANKEPDNSLYPIAVLIDELRNDDVNVSLCECEVCSKLRSLRESGFADVSWFVAVNLFEAPRC